MSSYRHLKPIEDLALAHPHGTRTRYRGGCRCLPCRKASADYQVELRRRIASHASNPVVSADVARLHLLCLKGQGLGTRAIAAASDVRKETIAAIRSGSKPRIRKNTELAILNVNSSARADGSYVPGNSTTELIDELRSEGFSVKILAHKLGFKGNGIPFYHRPWITALNAMRVKRLYSLLQQDSASSLGPLKPSLRGRRSKASSLGRETLPKTGDNMRPKKVILCVDGNEQRLSVRRFFFETRGFKVVSASSGREAIEAINQAAIDAVVVELALPDMDGNVLVEQIKETGFDGGTMLTSSLVRAGERDHSAHAFRGKGCNSPADILEPLKAMVSRKRGPKPVKSLGVAYLPEPRRLA